ncbi:putative alpha/beta hydrolase [Pestalotiopsis sp. NC0098]|nr:putative alpha/beta hydrolase [Pestalotiopsis sp. NC0098]
MVPVKTIDLPYLGIRAGYTLDDTSFDPSKPTCVLVNSMCMTSALFRPQFEDEKLTKAVNLVAIEPLGHGATTCASEQFTYWDSARMALLVLDHLKIDKFFALGTSQGGWLVTRLALLAPDRIQGLLLLGTSMDSETADSRTKGCWDPVPFFKPFLQQWTSATPTPDFRPSQDWLGACTGLGFGSASTAENTDFWNRTISEVYKGDEGRRKLRMATICLAERDGLLLRLDYIRCPVHWLQGTEDAVYSTQIATEQIALFTSSSDAKVDFVQGGAHYLSASNPVEVNQALMTLVKNSS